MSLSQNQELLEWLTTHREFAWMGLGVHKRHPAAFNSGPFGRSLADSVIVDLLAIFQHKPNPLDFPDQYRGSFLGATQDDVLRAVRTFGMSEKAIVGLKAAIDSNKTSRFDLVKRFQIRGYNPVYANEPEQRPGTPKDESILNSW